MSETKSEELTKLSWGGQIPLTFVLAAADVAQLHPPPARYVMASRMAYLPRLAEEAIQSFRQAVAPSGGGSQNVWFEAYGIPLKWQVPMGVLVDAVRTQCRPQTSSLPFQIVIHFHDFPNDKILACTGMEVSKWSYVNSLKQSACLRFGDVKKVLTGLSEIQREQMWDSLAVGNYSKFSQCNDSLHGVNCKDKGQRRCIRLVGVINSSDDEKGKKEGQGSNNEDKMDNSGGSSGILRNVLRPLKLTEETNGMTLKSFLKLGDNDIVGGVEAGNSIIVHGVEIPLNADIVDLHEMMSSADNCLYIVLSGAYVRFLNN